MSTEAYILDAIRTPRGRGKKGSLYEVKAVSLVSQLLERLRDKHQIPSHLIDDVVLGCVTPVLEQGGNIAKTAALLAGYSEKVSGMQVNRFCASGLEAVNLAAVKVRSGFEHLVIGGGIESMSRVPMGSDQGSWALDPETSIATGFVPQGISADLIATREGFSRDDVDEYAFNSHIKAAKAAAGGRLKSIEPVVDMNGFKILDFDENVRADASVTALSALKPSFASMGQFGFDAVALAKYHDSESINHVHTPGNSSAIVDGAAVVLLGTKTMAEQLKIKPRGRIVSLAVTGTESTIMLTGPAPASRLALQRAGLQAKDIGLFEVNEAFASVVMKFSLDMAVGLDRINVNGGAIAFGHPLGATGAMLVSMALDELELRQERYGLITLCVGQGMGIATIIERV